MGAGNIDADPCLLEPFANDYRLAPGSPCIDAADNTAVPVDVADVDGNGRFADDLLTDDAGGLGSPGYPEITEMGTGELQFCFGDLDGDGAVDLSDLTALLSVCGTTCPTGDGRGIAA